MTSLLYRTSAGISGFGNNDLICDPNDLADTCWTMDRLEHARTYYWHVCACNEAGASDWSMTGIFHTVDVPSGVERQSADIPNTFRLWQNCPNPFNASTTIRFDVPQTAEVRLCLYDCLGTCRQLLVDETLPAGEYQIFVRSDELPSGLYFVRLIAGLHRDVNKMVVVKGL